MKKESKNASKSKAIRLIILVVVLIVIILFAISAYNGSRENERTRENAITSTSENSQTKEVTREMYNQINNGMTENEVVSILGNPDSSSDSEISGVGKTVVYTYNKTYNDPVVTITFNNGRVNSKNWTQL